MMRRRRRRNDKDDDFRDGDIVCIMMMKGMMNVKLYNDEEEMADFCCSGSLSQPPSQIHTPDDEAMKATKTAGTISPTIAALATSLTKSVDPSSPNAKALALYKYVRDDIAFGFTPLFDCASPEDTVRWVYYASKKQSDL